MRSRNSLTYVVAGNSPFGNPEKTLDLATAPGYELFFSCFMGDVDLVIDDVDLGTHFGWVATVSFAISVRDAVRVLPRQGESAAEFQESQDRICFRLYGTDVHVSCTYSTGSAKIGYAELLQLAEDGLRTLLEGLYDEYPRLRANPSLRKALGGRA